MIETKISLCFNIRDKLRDIRIYKCMSSQNPSKEKLLLAKYLATGHVPIELDQLVQDTDSRERESLSPEEESSKKQISSSCRHFSAVINKVLQDQ